MRGAGEGVERVRSLPTLGGVCGGARSEGGSAVNDSGVGLRVVSVGGDGVLEERVAEPCDGGVWNDVEVTLLEAGREGAAIMATKKERLGGGGRGVAECAGARRGGGRARRLY
ncbi:hypothetical protein FGB62_3g242 [Gracilaria domingensis]|nr:hypothetical protein FGB62_3g242 [Gracilaria domingensis]